MERKKYDKEFKLEILHFKKEEGHSVAHRLPGISGLIQTSFISGRGPYKKNPTILSPKKELRKEEAYVRNSERFEKSHRIEIY